MNMIKNILLRYCKKRNLTYSITVYGDAYLETTKTDIKEDKTEIFEKKIDNIIIAKIQQW